MERAFNTAWQAIVLMEQAPPSGPEELPSLPLEASDEVATVRAREHDPPGTDLDVATIGDRKRPFARLRLKRSQGDRDCNNARQNRSRHLPNSAYLLGPTVLPARSVASCSDRGADRMLHDLAGAASSASTSSSTSPSAGAPSLRSPGVSCSRRMPDPRSSRGSCGDDHGPSMPLREPS